MRAVRFLTFALLMVVGFAGISSAQAYNNTPGVYTGIKVGIVPAALPPGSIPGGGPLLGPDLYTGTLTISKLSTGYSVTYSGVRADKNNARLEVSAVFTNDWIGFKLGLLVVGTSPEDGCITGIDGAHLVSATINGVGTVDNANHRVIAKFSAGPTLGMFKVLNAPGNLR
jgi:hypothetical protein